MQDDKFDEDMKRAYKAIKELANEANDGKVCKQEVTDYIRSRLRFKLGYITYHYKYGKYITNDYNRNRSENKRMKRFYKSKYNHMGLPSKEQVMVDKMIESVVDNLEINEASLATINSVVGRISSFADRAKKINSDCESIKTELDKIPNYLDTGSWAAEAG